jgi:hypothetical protein
MNDLVRILIAPLVWLAAFSAVYGLHGLLCGHQVTGVILGFSLAKVLLVAAFVLAIVVQVALLVALHAEHFAPQTDLVRFVSRAGGWTGLVATVWSLHPVIVTTPCH